MNIVILFIILCIVPSLAIPPVGRRPSRHLINRFHFLRMRSRTTARPKTATTTTTTTTAPTTTPEPEYEYITIPQGPSNLNLDDIMTVLEIADPLHSNAEKQAKLWKRLKKLFVWNDNGAYELTEEDMEKLLQCWYYKYFFYWTNSDNGYEITEHQAFCQRLLNCKPTKHESTDPVLARRFGAMLLAYSKLSPKKPFIPTRHEMQEMEDCYFGNQEPNRNISTLSPSDMFCYRLKRDILDGTKVLSDGSFYPFAFYHTYWHELTLIARKDYAQMTECHKVLFSQRSSGPCKQYYVLIKKPKTVRDVRRMQVDTCMRMQRMRNQKMWNAHKDSCLNMIDQYKRVFCQFKDD